MSVHKIEAVNGKTVYLNLPLRFTPDSLAQMIIAIQQISLLKYDRFDGSIIEFSTNGYLEVENSGYIMLKENKLDGIIEKELDLTVRFNYIDDPISLEELLKQILNAHWDEIHKIAPHIQERIQFEYS